MQCFAGFDLSKHHTFSTQSPSIQISITALRDALQDGFAFVTKGNEEIAIGFRPDQFLAYTLNSELLHAQGVDAATVWLIGKGGIIRTNCSDRDGTNSGRETARCRNHFTSFA
ncbi:MAG: hypothetical protein M5U34_07825 [Chloroflexi bacterium]|nr:hypothetical protein [Chloroflexota bacterium]